MGYLKLRVVNERKTNKPILKLKHAMQKLQKRLLLSMCRFVIEDFNKWDSTTEIFHHDDMGMVVEGHFPVVTIGDGGLPQKYFVPLSYLTNPTFLKLLEEMEREFGFDQQGVLALPCKAIEIQRIMFSKRAGGSIDWNL